ncbi:MAG TPA: alpha/beta fold hydrolase [Steroidobacter sp.]|uniref:alpha/beta fold hydrolase n=1 Tax=Steroidobacter sp. TaxID=1978227 RepID=UPI002ED9B27D
MASVSARPEMVARAFLTPRPPTRRQPLVLEGGETLRVTTPQGAISLQRAGAGPGVLLLHGWEGQASDLAAFAPPLLEAAFTVWAMDLPAHGDSAGEQTSIPQSARALSAVVDAIGPLHAVIAHSVGSAVLVEALHAQLSVQRAVLISAPAYYERHMRGFGAAAGLDANDIETMIALLSREIGVEAREVSMPGRAAHLNQPALFIHSADDRVVSIEDSLASAGAWRGARHLRVEGLGHRRILADPAVIAAAVEFVSITQ